MSKNIISLMYFFVLILACLALNSIESEKSTSEEIYTDVNTEVIMQQEVTMNLLK